eukprot:CCRYP_001491-RA/>CCRYP_001491-RA protein AED:0.64 eAED:0.37 QI:0/-1/0/1/-1/0/1/0/105
MAESPDYVGDGHDDDDDKLEPLTITQEVLIELIKNTMQPEDLNVRMVKEGDNEVEVEEDEEDEGHITNFMTKPKTKCAVDWSKCHHDTREGFQEESDFTYLRKSF